MSDLYMAFDPSSSGSKAFYTGNPFKCEWMFQEPVVVPVSKSAIEQYQSLPMLSTDITRSSWIEVKGNSYAVGSMASDYFYGSDKIKTLKFEMAIYKIVAMVGAIGAIKQFPKKFTLSLGVLLPYCEYADRKLLKELLSEVLSEFSFRGTLYQVKLVSFNCLPEGSGLLMRGLEPRSALKEKNILVLMVGYRNASVLVIKRGVMEQMQTTELGFIRFLEMLERATSGVKSSELVGPVCAAGHKINRTPLKSLLKTTDSSLQGTELKLLMKEIKNASGQYWLQLTDWLKSRQFSNLDQVVLAGGTSRYYQPQLEKWFRPLPVTWGEELEASASKVLAEQGQQLNLSWRMTDIYGYFFYMYSTVKKQASKIA